MIERKSITKAEDASREHILVIVSEDYELTEEKFAEMQSFLSGKPLAVLEAIEESELRDHIFRWLCFVKNLNESEQDAAILRLKDLSREDLIAIEKKYFKNYATAADIPVEEPAENVLNNEYLSEEEARDLLEVATQMSELAKQQHEN